MTRETTTLEAAVLDCIARNLYQPTNGGRPECFSDTSAIWSADIIHSTCSPLAASVKPRALPGVCSSLVKKGYVVSQRGTGKDDPGVIWLTELGFLAWRSRFFDAQ